MMFSEPLPEEIPSAQPAGGEPAALEPPLPAPTPQLPVPQYRWYHKFWAVLLITFCLDIGLFLLIFPWTDGWDNFLAFAHHWRQYCDTMYVRGAISGIGVVNLYISLGEVFRLRRFSRH
jgi:hypothetical protein